MTIIQHNFPDESKLNEIAGSKKKKMCTKDNKISFFIVKKNKKK